jgi:hypothetical protein
MNILKKISAVHIEKIPALFFWICIFLLVVFGQYLLILPENIVDHSMWASQARYFETNYFEQFNILWAYGHPGGPLILSTIAITHLFGIDYTSALTVCLILLNSLIILAIIYTIKRLSSGTLWWLWSIPLLLFHHAYTFNTPPSMLTMFISLFQFLYTVFLYQKERIETKHAILFGLFCGFAIATRTDMGTFLSLVFGLTLIRKISFAKIGMTTVTAVLFFFLFDPFMWFMPIEHIADLIYKITYHYSDFGYVSLGYGRFFAISSAAILSAIIGVVSMLKKDITFPLPKTPIWILLATTIFVFSVFLTSDYKAERYFFPLIIIWEVLLLFFIDIWAKFFEKKYTNLSISRYTYILYITIIICNLV